MGTDSLALYQMILRPVHRVPRFRPCESSDVAARLFPVNNEVKLMVGSCSPSWRSLTAKVVWQRGNKPVLGRRLHKVILRKIECLLG